MRTVTFETQNATFSFDAPDAISSLKYYATEHKVTEAAKLLLSIESSAFESIKISSRYFGYIVLDLLGKEKGSVFCNSCEKSYLAGQLHSKPIGFGRSPFEVNIKDDRGILKRLFGKRKSVMCMRGGEAYDCPRGHELVGMITWIT